jgi:integrase
MSVRKRTWTTAKGEQRTAWVADFSDQHGNRQIKTFRLRREAEAYSEEAGVAVRGGTFSTPSRSPTIKQAATAWLEAATVNGLETTTIAGYRQHVDLHIVPKIGTVKLAKLTAPMIQAFVDELRVAKSVVLARKVLVSLKSMLRHAMTQGSVAQNVALAIKIESSKRHQKKLEVGKDIPDPTEIQRLLAAASGQLRPLLITAVFCGLRASELRGLCWDAIDFEARTITVRQRADALREIGRPKSEAGQRTIPMPPMTINVLREWKLACPKNKLQLVFPSRSGGVQHYKDIARRLEALQVETGMVDATGEPKYTLHALRHFFASWCINPKERGGRGLPAKVVQDLLGHSTIAMTLDTYGHLFASENDVDELAAAERRLLG